MNRLIALTAFALLATQADAQPFQTCVPPNVSRVVVEVPLPPTAAAHPVLSCPTQGACRYQTMTMTPRTRVMCLTAADNAAAQSRWVP